MKPAVLLIALILAGCQTSKAAPRCGGQAFALNQGRWQPAAIDLKPCVSVKGAPR